MNHILDYMQYQTALQLRTVADRTRREVWDAPRRAYVALTPEELVRQLVLQYMVQTWRLPLTHTRTEYALTINGQPKRCDILVFDRQTRPFLMVECKAASVKIDETVFFQAAQYNLTLEVPFFMLTNGIMTYICERKTDGNYGFVTDIDAMIAQYI